MTDNLNLKIRKLKRAVIKEELVELTGDFKEAVVLNQLIFWSERVKDSDQFIHEELERQRKFADGSVESAEDIIENLQNGWIYKTADEMVEEVMITVSKRTMERVFISLVEKDYISRRRNPKYKWDKTWQYRVNLNKIQIALSKLGYSLEGYSLISKGSDDEKPDNNQNTNSDDQNVDISSINNDVVSNGQNDASKRQNDVSRRQNDVSKRQNDVSKRHPVAAIPKITTKTTTEITSETTSNNFLEEEEDINLNKTKITKLENSTSEMKKYEDELRETLHYKKLIRENDVLKNISNLLLLSEVDPDKIIKIIIGIESNQINADFDSAKEQLKHCEVKQSIEPIYDFVKYYLNGLSERCSNNNIKTYNYAPEENHQEHIPMFDWTNKESAFG